MGFTQSQWKQFQQILQEINHIILSKIQIFHLSLALTPLSELITVLDLRIIVGREFTVQLRKTNVLSHPQVTFTKEPLMKKLWIWGLETNKKTSMENLDSRLNQMWKKCSTMSGTEIHSRVCRQIKWFRVQSKFLEKIKGLFWGRIWI